MKKSKLLLFLMIAVLALFCCACSGSQDSSDDTKADSIETEAATEEEENNPDLEEQEGTGINFAEEADEVEIERVPTETSEFIGKWKSTSDRAHYLYGNVNIEIREDNTWSGDITGEKLEGTWTEEDDHIHCDNDLFSFDLAYSSTGKLIMIETLDDDDDEGKGEIDTVLTKE